jgi:hypothetical protein
MVTVSNTPTSTERGTARLRFYPSSYLQRARLFSHLPRMVSAGAVSILSWTTLNLFTSTPKFEWIPLPGDPFVNGAPRSMPTGRPQHAIGDPRVPIFTRIAAVSPALLALPPSEPEQSVDNEVAMAEVPSFPESDPSEDQTVSLSDEAKPSFSFAGVWAPTANACSPKSNKRDLLPAVINKDGAWAGEVTCRFAQIRQSGDAAVVTSTCSNGRERWTAKVRLTVAGDRLRWSSARGTQNYVRCAPRIVEARARV